VTLRSADDRGVLRQKSIGSGKGALSLTALT